MTRFWKGGKKAESDKRWRDKQKEKFKLLTPEENESRLQYGRQKQREWRKKNPTRTAWTNLLGHARRLKIIQELTYIYFSKLVQEKCYLCNDLPQIGCVHGIDRIDATEGYTLWNSRTCCDICNYMKNQYKLDVVLDKARKWCENWQPK